MKLRFMKKKDGSKVLQMRTEGSEYKDVPTIEEKSIKDEVCEAIERFRCLKGEYPDGVMVGKVDYAHLKEEMNRYSLFPERGFTTINFMGIPAMEHPEKYHGIFLLVEAGK